MSTCCQARFLLESFEKIISIISFVNCFAQAALREMNFYFFSAVTFPELVLYYSKWKRTSAVFTTFIILVNI